MFYLNLLWSGAYKLLSIIPGRAEPKKYIYGPCHANFCPSIIPMYTTLALLKYFSPDSTQCSHHWLFIKKYDKYFKENIYGILFGKNISLLNLLSKIYCQQCPFYCYHHTKWNYILKLIPFTVNCWLYIAENITKGK